MNDIPLIAGGDIRPARFVSLSAAANNTVLESNAGDSRVVGITTEALKAAVGATLAAEEGDQVRVHQANENCLLTVGAGGCTAGDYMTPDADGKGTVATVGLFAYFQAYETASAGELVHGRVLSFTIAPTHSP